MQVRHCFHSPLPSRTRGNSGCVGLSSVGPCRSSFSLPLSRASLLRQEQQSAQRCTSLGVEFAAWQKISGQVALACIGFFVPLSGSRRRRLERHRHPFRVRVGSSLATTISGSVEGFGLCAPTSFALGFPARRRARSIRRNSCLQVACAAQIGQSTFDALSPAVTLLGAALAGSGVIAALAVAVLLHESGHFVCARSVGLPVKEFSIGFGPRIRGAGWKGDTSFVLRWLPFGGYVKFDDAKTEALPDGTMVTKLDALPCAARLWVLAGGPLANVLTAWLCLAGAALTVGVPRGSELPGLKVEEVAPSIATEAGLRVGDVLLRIGDKDFGTTSPDLVGLDTLLQQLPLEEPVECLVQRGGEEVRLALQLQADPVTGLPRLGVALGPNFEQVWQHADSVPDAAGVALDFVVQIVGAQVVAIGGLATGALEAVGPLGALVEGQQLTAADGLTGVGIFFVVANLNLAFVNALPVPALDGGKAIFVLAEAALGRRVDENVRLNIEVVFAVAFFLTLVGLTARDVQQLLNVVT